MKQKVWNFLRTNKNKNVKEIIIEFKEYKKETIKQYLNILYKAKYLTATNTTTRGLSQNSKLFLKKDTGEIAPTFYKGVFRDKNILKEIKIYKDKDYKTKDTYLKYYLQAIVELNEDEVLNSVLVSKFKELCPQINEDDKNVYSKIIRYLNKLIEKGFIIKNESSNRSFYLQIDLLKVRTLYKQCNNLNFYNLL